MQVVGPLATAVVNVYIDGALIISFSGDVTVTGLTSYNCASFSGLLGNTPWLSEFIVADEDLRAWNGLLTMALTGAGTTDAWTGVYSTINGTTLSTASPNYVNVVNQDQQFINTAAPSGIFGVKAIKIAATSLHVIGFNASALPTRLQQWRKQRCFWFFPWVAGSHYSLRNLRGVGSDRSDERRGCFYPK